MLVTWRPFLLAAGAAHAPETICARLPLLAFDALGCVYHPRTPTSSTRFAIPVVGLSPLLLLRQPLASPATPPCGSRRISRGGSTRRRGSGRNGRSSRGFGVGGPPQALVAYSPSCWIPKLPCREPQEPEQQATGQQAMTPWQQDWMFVKPLVTTWIWRQVRVLPRL